MAITPPDPNDAALVSAALAGDERALADLLAIYQQTAYNVAYRLLGNDADARDAVQDGFLQAVRAVRGELARPRQVDRFAPWLRQVVANAARGQLRRRPLLPLACVHALADILPAPDRLGPADELEQKELLGGIVRTIAALPKMQRAALVLRECLGLSYREIAETLGVTLPAAERLLFRARRGFRAIYQRVAEEGEPLICPDLAWLVLAAAGGGPEGAAWQDLEDHLEDCRSCRRDSARLRAVGARAADR